MHHVEASPAQEAAEAPYPPHVELVAGAQADGRHAERSQLSDEVILPGQEVGGFVVEGFTVAQGGVGDEEALCAPRPQSLGQPQHPQTGGPEFRLPHPSGPLR